MEPRPTACRLSWGPTSRPQSWTGDRRWYRPGAEPALPVEFTVAAFRYGHSQIRETYRLNVAMPPSHVFPALAGVRPVPADHVADWSLLFDLPGHPPAPRRAERTDERLVPSSIRLPVEITGEVAVIEHRSLAVRELGWTWETPLWLYVLKEPQVSQDGHRRGPVGGRIVAECFTAVVDAAPRPSAG